MKIAITGSTGQLGRIVVKNLQERLGSEPLVALARNPDKARDLGVGVRQADYDDAAAWPKALEGVDFLLLISASELGKRVVQHKNVIDAAKAGGVKRIAYTSVLHADTSVLSLAQEHRNTEELIRASGLSWTMLRNGWYTENYTGSLGGAVGAGAVLGSAGSGRISSAARADFAEAAAVVMAEPGHQEKVYELAGDEAYTLSDLAAEVSRQTGKEIPYKDLSETEYAQVLKDLGVPPAFAEAIAGFDVAASQGALFDDTKTLSQLLGRPTTSLESSVRQALAKL